MSDDKTPEEFAIPLPLRRLLQVASTSEDLAHMAMEQKRLELWAFLDGLTREQLLALRSVLNLNGAGIQFVDGMVAAQLRLLHRVDPDSGEDLPAALT